MAFANETELENFTGLAVATARADLLLDLASAAVVDVAGIAIAQDTSTDDLIDAHGGHELVLPEWPVTAVTSVTIIDDDNTEDVLRGPSDTDPEYRWSETGVLTRIGAWWPDRDRSVKITYTHGFATVPEGIKKATLLAASRGLSNPLGWESEAIGDWSGSRGERGGLSIELTAGEERMVLKALRP